jgi:phage baseplate assembly protein W
MSDSFGREVSSRITLSQRVKTYVDVSLSFNPSPITNDITLLTNERAVNNSIKNIIMFLPSEVPFDSDIGSNAQKYLFDVADSATAGLLSGEIERAILFCEPRVTFFPPKPEEISLSQYRGSDPVIVDNLFFQDDLGVFVEVQPDQNNFAVTVKYRIIGSERIFKVQEILTPTR